MKTEITYLAEPNPAGLNEAVRRADELIQQSGMTDRLQRKPSQAVEYADRWELIYLYDLPLGKRSAPGGIAVDVKKDGGTARILQGR